MFSLSSTHVLGQEVFGGYIITRIRRHKELTGEIGKQPSKQNVTAIIVEECQAYLMETTNEEAQNSPFRFLWRGEGNGQYQESTSFRL